MLAQIFLLAIVIFIISLIVVIISGSILAQIENLSDDCQDSDAYKNAKKRTSWVVGISSTAAGLALLAIIILIAWPLIKVLI